MPIRETPRRSRLGAALRRLGVGGFLFFLIKGLLWLTLPGTLVALQSC